jgi:hypothetical protein
MTVHTDRRAILGAVLAGAASLSTPSLAGTSSPRDGRVAAIAKHIGY